MPQWFKFLISSHADCSSLRLSLHFSPPLAGLPLLFLLFAVLKPSNEIHIKQDGRLDAFLPAIHSAACLLLHLCFFFPLYSLSLHLPSLYCLFCSFPSVLCTFLHLSLSSSFFSMDFLFFQVLFFNFSLLTSAVVFVFIHSSYSLAIHLQFLCYPMFCYISISTGST